MNRLRDAVEFVAGLIFFGASLGLGAFMFFWFYAWWGALGVVGAVVFAPMITIFPFIYLYLEGPSTLLFSLWGAAAVAAMIARIRTV